METYLFGAFLFLFATSFLLNPGRSKKISEGKDFWGREGVKEKGGSICKELSRPIYILDVLWYNYIG